jgi:glutamine amidotransferase
MIAVIDYEAGNLTSVSRALSYLGYPNKVTGDMEAISNAERVIFPGVGSAGAAMDSLKRLGLDTLITQLWKSGKPILGICLGTQIILGHSEEHDTPCLNIIEGHVRMFDAKDRDDDGSSIKIPHMGWNRVALKKKHPVLAGVKSDDEFYFVHSYYPAPSSQEHVIGTTRYGKEFASIIGIGNLVATQFHPEKSGRAGLNILKNFCEWKPC